jgi:chromosome segregation ATPase
MKLTKEELQEIRDYAEFMKECSDSARKIFRLLSHIEQLTEQFNHAKDNYNRALMQDELSQKVIEQQAQEIERLKIENEVVKRQAELITKYRIEAQRLEEAFEEIDNHIRCTDDPIPYIVKTLKEVKGE